MSDHVHQVAIVGAGFAGIGTAIRLRQPGSTTSSSSNGPTARAGHGATTPIPCGLRHPLASLLLFVRAEPVVEPDLLGSARDPGLQSSRWSPSTWLDELIRYDTTVTDLTFDEPAGLWRVSVEGGETVLARTAVFASGRCPRRVPDIAGIEEYAGSGCTAPHGITTTISPARRSV